jgi:pimeloyl-ACP methyl ester carboxylesterase
VTRGSGALVLQKQGSFFVGGELVFSDGLLGVPIPGWTLPPTGNIMVNQMYVQYQIPTGSDQHVPVVMVHGGTLTGKSFEETPDGRMGWYEYFARQHRAVYVVDLVSRGRSGFDPTIINNVARGILPTTTLPTFLRLSPEFSWTAWRYGPSVGTPYADSKFPLEAIDEISKQAVPDLNAATAFNPGPDPSVSNLVRLVRKLGSAILMGHSQTAFFPERAALLESAGIRGIISLEVICSMSLTAEQVTSLAKIPILVVFGDHIAESSVWKPAFEQCGQFVNQLNRAGGDAKMLHLPDAGQFGNSHLFMMDKNNLEVADLILEWIDDHVER